MATTFTMNPGQIANIEEDWGALEGYLRCYSSIRQALDASSGR